MLPQYDRIPKSATAQELLDTAIHRMKKTPKKTKGIKERLAKVKATAKDSMRVINNSLLKSLRQVHDAYPSFDHMSEFTSRIFELDMEPGRVKQALGGVQGAMRTIQELTGEHARHISHAGSEARVATLRKAWLGRISSVMRRIDRHIKLLNESRLVFRQLPVVDDELFTVAIAGFPNVGKSTLLKRITSAKPEIKAYAFTTKGLNCGYFEFRYNRIQCIDTPGTLNRKRMNDVERKAEITLQYLSNCIVYVFDPTEGSYPLKDQVKLYEHILDLDKPVVVYISKTDIADEDVVKEILKKHTDALIAPEKVKKELGKHFKEWL